MFIILYSKIIPLHRIDLYCYNGSGNVPKLETHFFSALQITIKKGNPIVLITMVLCFIDLFSSIFSLVTNNKNA